MFIDSKVFIDMYECFIDKLYGKFSEFSKYKGYIIVFVNWSIVDLLNVTLTRKGFFLDDKNLFKEKNSRKRLMLSRHTFKTYFNS